MVSLTVALSLAAVAAYVALGYVNGRVIVRLVTPSAEPLSVAGAPLLGAAAMGIQLWLYGSVSIPWNPITLVLPWLVVWVVMRRSLLEALRSDWTLVRSEARALRRQDGLTGILVAVTALLVITYTLNLVTQPLTAFDAISMWFFKAKHFYTQASVDLSSIPGLATYWPADPGPYRVTAGVIRSLDYPPLFPLMVASIYAMTWGVHDTLGKGVDAIFIVTSVAILWFALSGYAGVARAAVMAFLVAAITVVQTALGDPLYTGYVDYPVGVVMLASLANVHRGISGRRSEPWVFAILFASIAALLKSEGLPFLAAVAVTAALRSRRVIFAPPVVIGIALVVAWQVFAAYHGWRSHHLLNDNLASLPFLAPGRAALIVVYVVEVIAVRLDYLWLAAAFGLTLLLAIRQSRAVRPVVLVFVFQCAVYFGVFVLNPGELVGSLDRLIIQLAPSVVLMFGLALGEAQDQTPTIVSPQRMELVRQ